MSVEDVTWIPPEHTKAKHQILKGYLDAWAPIMSQQAAKSGGRSPLYVDAFAGPGIYQDGSDGSPLVAMRAVLDHPLSIPSPIRMSFIELDEKRFESLQTQLVDVQGVADLSRAVIENVLNTSCQKGLRDLMDAEKRKHGTFGSALVFLDQFGYSQAPMDLIGEIMSGTSCETLIYLEYQRMNHTLADPDKAAALTRTFGSDKWEGALKLEGGERVAFLRNCYKDALYEAGAAYVWDFEMRGQNNQLLSWLFFCTSSERGLEEMKKAMCRLDLTGNFRFSDRHVGQLNLLAESFDPDWLADHLHDHFKGESVELGAVRRYVLTETPLIRYKEALGRLERSGKLRVVDPPEGRRRGSFNFDASVLIELLPGSPEQTRLF